LTLNRLADRGGNDSAKPNHFQTANDVTKDLFSLFFSFHDSGFGFLPSMMFVLRYLDPGNLR